MGNFELLFSALTQREAQIASSLLEEGQVEGEGGLRKERNEGRTHTTPSKYVYTHAQWYLLVCVARGNHMFDPLIRRSNGDDKRFETDAGAGRKSTLTLTLPRPASAALRILFRALAYCDASPPSWEG